MNTFDMDDYIKSYITYNNGCIKVTKYVDYGFSELKTNEDDLECIDKFLSDFHVM